MVQLCWPFTSKLSKTPHTVPLLLQQCTSILSTPWFPDLSIICTISSISVFIMDINKARWRTPKTIIPVIMVFLFLFCNLGIGKSTWNLCPFQTKNTLVCVQIKCIQLNSDCLMLVLLLRFFFFFSVLLCLIHISVNCTLNHLDYLLQFHQVCWNSSCNHNHIKHEGVFYCPD